MLYFAGQRKLIWVAFNPRLKEGQVQQDPFTYWHLLTQYVCCYDSPKVFFQVGGCGSGSPVWWSCWESEVPSRSETLSCSGQRGSLTAPTLDSWLREVPSPSWSTTAPPCHYLACLTPHCANKPCWLNKAPLVAY